MSFCPLRKQTPNLPLRKERIIQFTVHEGREAIQEGREAGRVVPEGREAGVEGDTGGEGGGWNRTGPLR